MHQPLMAMSSYAGAAHAFSQQDKVDALADCLDGLRTQAQRARELGPGRTQIEQTLGGGA